MYAIVRKENGNYYTSIVFGFYQGESYSKNFWLVLNQEKTALIKQCVLNPDNKYIEVMVLITDCDKSNWTERSENARGFHGVDYLPEQIISMIENHSVPDEILNRCIKEDNAYTFEEYPKIKTQQDIKNLDWATGGFHDAYIKEIKQNGDMLYVRFDGTWSCEVELWFSGDVEYDASSRDPEKYDPYWYDSTVLLKDGFIYLVDEEELTEKDLTAEKIKQAGYCWFKARNMKYHIIPD